MGISAPAQHVTRQFGKLGLIGCLCLGLGACQMQTPSSQTTRLIERDIEAPDLYDRRESALWPGEISSAGAWASSSHIRAPQRVVLRHPDNGNFVIATLFPSSLKGVTLSSDAAQALKIPAKTPQDIQITALRRQGEQSALPPQGVLLDSNIDLAPNVAPSLNVQAQGAGQIQIGMFSIEANAKAAIAQLNAKGVSAQSRQTSLRGKPSWTVTASGDTNVLNTVKAAGFADAYSLK